MTPKESLEEGKGFPFDGSNEYLQNKPGSLPPQCTDWAMEAARGIIANMQCRPRFRPMLNPALFHPVDRILIVSELSNIIREAAGVTRGFGTSKN